jgi:hypothetical protein
MAGAVQLIKEDNIADVVLAEHRAEWIRELVYGKLLRDPRLSQDDIAMLLQCSKDMRKACGIVRDIVEQGGGEISTIIMP